MKPAPFFLTCSVCLAVASAACSGDKACLDESSGANVAADPLTGSVVLAPDAPVTALGFDVTIDSLPAIWPLTGAFFAGMDATIVTRYQDDSDAGGTVQRQMPRLQLTLSSAASETSSETTTDPFPSVGGSSVNGSVLKTCVSSSTDSAQCCPFGATSCTDHVTVTVRRLDGAPFPPVVVAWTASASAVVNRCPFETSARLAIARNGMP
jgi:hypothetical protein